MEDAREIEAGIDYPGHGAGARGISNAEDAQPPVPGMSRVATSPCTNVIIYETRHPCLVLYIDLAQSVERMSQSKTFDPWTLALSPDAMY